MSARTRLVVVLAAAVTLAVSACGSGGDSATPAVGAASRPPSAAVAEGMCAEHGVLEALCTKCNPALIPIFQKKGDWCTEHGLPESICPICHPERGGRPAAGVDVAVDESPPDGIRVRLASAEIAEVAGLRTVAVEAAPTDREVGRELGAIAVIHYDATRVARLNPRAEGVVKALSVDVGSHVTAGTLLAQIESAAIGESEARIATARARLALARKQAGRLAALAADGTTSTRALEEARGAAREAEGEVAALVAAQALMGPTEGRAYRIESPIEGVVVGRTASIGAFVDRDDVLFEIVDTRVMWADIEIAEVDIATVRTGLAVTLTVEGLPGRTFSARVSYVAPEVDPHSRTVLARAALDNAEGVLRANMFARAAVRGLGDPEPARDAGSVMPEMIVPGAAIQVAKKVSLVFVQVEPDVYEGRRVTVGRTLGDGRVEVRGRLQAGDRVVHVGAFILKTETLKDSIGAGCCADDGGK